MPDRDRVRDELGVLLDEVLEAALLEVLLLVLLFVFLTRFFFEEKVEREGGGE